MDKIIKLNMAELSLSILNVENELDKNMVNVSANITKDMDDKFNNMGDKFNNVSGELI